MFTMRSIPGVGLYIEPWDVMAVARLAVTVGDVLQFDVAKSDAASENLVFGALNSGFTNIIAPSATGVVGGSILCVALESFADDTLGKVRIVGVCDTVTFTGSVTAGAPCVANTSKQLTATLAAGERIVAIGLDSLAGTPGVFLFNGFSGFGTDT